MTAAIASGQRRADIQGLRGLAVTLVVLFHTGLLFPSGFIGVDVFFVISGFVITRLLWAELRTTGRLDLPAFYARRARRLLPALACLLTTVALGTLIFESPFGSQGDAARTGIAAVLFAANAQLVAAGNGGYFATPVQANPLLHTWTLAVEEQFYLVFPALLLLGARLDLRRSKLALGRVVVLLPIGIAFVGSLLFSALLSASDRAPFATVPENRALAFYGSPDRAWEFALGSLLALGELRMGRLGPSAATACGVVGFALVALGALVYSENTPFPGTAALAPVAGAGLLIVAGTPSPLGVASLLSVRPLTWIGDLSYGWYLWHWPFVVFTRAIWPEAAGSILLAAAVASLLPTWLSYRFVEGPVRADKTIVGRRALSLVRRCAVVPAALLFGVLVTTIVPPNATVRDIRFQIRAHADESRGCLKNLPSDPWTSDSCTWRAPGSSGTIVLIGDSNAGQFVEPVAVAANGEGFDLTVAVFGGCPFADVIIHYDSIDEVACRNFVTAWTAWLEHFPPALVILANASSDYLADPTSDRANPLGHVLFESVVSHERASTVGDKLRLWGEGIAATVRRLDDRKVPVVLVQTIPHFPVASFDLKTCPAFRIYADQAACGTVLSRARVRALGAPARAVEERTIADIPRARGVDFGDDICTALDCSTYRDGRWLYRDSGHLSVAGALSLAGRFTELIRANATR